MNNWMSDIKLYVLNAGTLALSFTNLDMILKLLLLIVSIGYTINKWWLLQKKYDQDKSDK
jgi:hypothetical protein|tara:strand:- start:344 stop:523 length:180 start_codon:yes stop_codon:yes gene_type:complete